MLLFNSANIFNIGIEAHVQWKLNLIRHIEYGYTQNMNEATDRHICELGKWIYGEGVRYNHLPSFDLMCVTHEKFHRAAAEVVHYSNAGNKVKAHDLLMPDSVLSQVSTRLVKSLMDCSMECGKEACGSLIHEIKHNSTVSDILKAKENKILSIDAAASVNDAITMMVDNDIGSLAVYKDDRILGIFTETGYLRNIALKGRTTLATPVSDMIDLFTIYVDPHASIDLCMVLMTANHSRHLPVIDNGKLIGMVSIGDLIKKIILDDDNKLSQLEGYVYGQYGA